MKPASNPLPKKMAGGLRVPIATVASAPRLLAEAGACAKNVATSAGLDPNWFDDPTQTLTFEEIGTYLSECVRATGDDSFPFRVGLAEGLTSLTAVGYLAQNSATVRAALANLSDHIHHFAGAILVKETAGLASLEYSFMLPWMKGAGLITEAAMGIAVSLLHQLCGDKWKPVELRLARKRPLRVSAWQQCVQAPVQFGARNNILVFRTQDLTHRLERNNADFQHILLKLMAEASADRDEDFTRRVCAVIRMGLLAGDVSSQQIAVRLGISPRTLRRRLRGEGTNFETLQEQMRFEVARDLLEHSTATITQIADQLGYAHSSALSRAFRRWTGLSPRNWRSELNGD